jgi:hypothetical protein
VGNLLNVVIVVSSSAFKVFTCFVPVGLLHREKTIKQFRKDVPVWMDEEYL